MLFKLGPKTLDTKNLKGIWPYVLSKDSSYLAIRYFDDDDKVRAFEAQNHICRGVNQRGETVGCGKKFIIEEMQADHIIPWSRGGKTVLENCQVLCAECN